MRLLLAAAIVAALPAAAQTPDACAVHGEVRDSVTHALMPKTAIRLDSSGPFRYTGSSDTSGKFCFKTVEPGDYYPSVVRHGYLRDAWSARFHVVAGQDAELRLEATPSAVITGRVTSPDGEPVANAGVSLLRLQWRHGLQVWMAVSGDDSDDRGEFRFGDLEPGRYAVAAHPLANPGAFLALGVREAPGDPEWCLGTALYPPDPSGSPTVGVDVSAGQALPGIELKLPRTACFGVRGRSEATNTGSMTKIEAIRLDRQGSPMAWEKYSTVIHHGGAFEFRGIPAGRYLVFLSVPSSFMPGKMGSPSTTVTVSDRDVEGVAVHTGTAELRVKLSFEDPNMKLPDGSMVWLERMEFDFSYEQAVAKNNLARFEKLVPGRYRIWLEPAARLYAKTMVVGQQPVAELETRLQPGVTGMELVLASGAGTATVSPENAAGGAAVAQHLTALLVPLEEKPGQPHLYWADADQSGSASLSSVPPGEYRAFLVEDFERGLWWSREFFQQVKGQGKAVTLDENGSVQAQAPILTAREVEAAIARMGQ